MSDLLWQGLGLSVAGMGLTFGALSLIVGAMYVLQRVFPVPPPSAPEGHGPAETSPAGVPETDTEEEEIAAAIAVALVHLRSVESCRSRLGAALEAGRSPWWTVGQLQRPPRTTRRTRGKGSE